MAENELLDLGNGWHFRKWRASLENRTLTAEARGKILGDELVSVMRTGLLGEPLMKILHACSENPQALRAAIASYKFRDLAWLGKRVYEQNKGASPLALAEKIVSELSFRVQDRARAHSLNCTAGNSQGWHEDLQAAVNDNLQRCRRQLVSLVLASLMGSKLPRLVRSATEPRRTPREVANISLIKSVRSDEPRHV